VNLPFLALPIMYVAFRSPSVHSSVPGLGTRYPGNYCARWPHWLAVTSHRVLQEYAVVIVLFLLLRFLMSSLGSLMRLAGMFVRQR
jgi:hypothetical protein